MGSRLAVRVVLVLVAAGVIVYMKTQARSDDSKVVKSEMVNAIHTMPEYPNNKKLLDMWTDRAHSVAFDHAYKLGGRRQSNSFDEKTYVHEFFKSMIDSANGFARHDIAKTLLSMQANYDASTEAETKS